MTGDEIGGTDTPPSGGIPPGGGGGGIPDDSLPGGGGITLGGSGGGSTDDSPPGGGGGIPLGGRGGGCFGSFDGHNLSTCAKGKSLTIKEPLFNGSVLVYWLLFGYDIRRLHSFINQYMKKS